MVVSPDVRKKQKKLYYINSKVAELLDGLENKDALMEQAKQVIPKPSEPFETSAVLKKVIETCKLEELVSIDGVGRKRIYSGTERERKKAAAAAYRKRKKTSEE